MSNQNKKGGSRESYFASYKTSKKYESNRLAKLMRLAKEQPNNEQIKKAIDNIRPRRTTPKTEQWTPTQVAIAKLVKYFTGKFDRNWFSPDMETQVAATRARNHNLFKVKPPTESSRLSPYSIGARAHDGRGNKVWS